MSSPQMSSIDAQMLIATDSILRVLKGVIVATKATESLQLALEERIHHHAVAENNLPLSDASESTPSTSLPFTQWETVLFSPTSDIKHGVRQLAQLTLAVALLREKARSGTVVNAQSLDLIWSLIYKAIISEDKTELHFSVTRSAQGFLAVPLCSLVENGRIDELWRLHTWLPDGQRGVSEEVCIHAHNPFGQSWILLGQGTDCTFEATKPVDASQATHAAYECCYMSADNNQSTPGYQTHQISSTIRNTGKLFTVRAGGREPHTRDMTYSVPGGAYHRSIVSGSKLHATLFVFDASRGYDEDAAVLGPKDGTEYCQTRDPGDITPKVLVQVVDATRKWEQSQISLSHESIENDTIMAYYQYFRARGLLETGRQSDALQYLYPAEGLSPMQIFARDPSQQHNDYLDVLSQFGIVQGIASPGKVRASDALLQFNANPLHERRKLFTV